MYYKVEFQEEEKLESQAKNQEDPNPVTPFHMQAERPWEKLIINDFWGSVDGVQINDDENCAISLRLHMWKQLMQSCTNEGCTFIPIPVF